MLWQDYALFVLDGVLFVGNIPILFSTMKPPAKSALTTSIALFAIAATLVTLGLIATPIVIGLSGVTWGIVAYQSSQIK